MSETERNKVFEDTLTKTLDSLVWSIPLPPRVFEQLGWSEVKADSERVVYSRNDRVLVARADYNPILFPNEKCYRASLETDISNIQRYK